MKALVKTARGQGNMEIRDIPEPKGIGADEVKVEVKAAGICGSDLHIYHDDIAIALNPPVVPGHEFSGVITELGSAVNGWNVGDRVVPELGFVLCGECYACRHGFPNLCDNRRSVGYWYNGGFTKYTVVKACGVHRLPDAVSFDEGALIEPLACAVHAVYGLTNIVAGDYVFVSGPGTLGLMSLQLANAVGAVTIVTGRSSDAKRLEVARSLGADYVFNGETVDVAEQVRRITNGTGVDVVLECSGNEHAVTEGLSLIRKRGSFTQIGLFGDRVTIDYEKVCYKEVTLVGSLGQVWGNWEKALQLVDLGLVQLQPLATTRLPITDWEKAFAMFEKKEGIKILLFPVDE